MIVGANTNVAVRMDACKYCSLVQLTVGMFEAGGSIGGICTAHFH